MSKMVKINNVDYKLDDLSKNARQLLSNIRVAESKLAQLNREAGLIQTARNVYAQALLNELPKQAEAAAAE